MTFARFFQTLLLLCLPALAAWLWFTPVFWDLSSNQSSFWQGLTSVFFFGDDKEFFLGDTTDLQGTVWIFNHFASIVEGDATTTMPYVYAPIGFDVGLNTGFAWADAALAYPYVRWIGIPGFYNLHVFITLWLNGVLLTLLFRQTNVSLPIALGLAGVCIHNDVVAEELLHGRPTQVHLWFHALFLIAILKLTQLREDNTVKWSLFGGAMLAGSCLTYWFGGASLGFIAAIIAALSSLSRPANFRTFSLPRIKDGLILSAVALGIAALCTWRLSAHYLSGGGSLFDDLQPTTWTEWTFLGRTIPLTSVAHIYSWDGFVEAITRNTLPTALWWVWGLSLIPIAFKQRWPWMLGASLALFLPLPSAFNFGEIWVPTTNALLHWIFPPMERCGFPERLVVTPILVIGISASMALARMEDFIKGKSGVAFWIVSLSLGGVLFSNTLDGIPSKPATSALKADRDVLMVTSALPGGIIHVPVEESGNAFIQQMFHKQPILTGPGADTVRPKEHVEYCESNTLLRAIELLAKENHPLQPVFSEEDRLQLVNDGFAWIQVDLRKSASPAKAYIDLLGHDGLLRVNRHFLAISLLKEDADKIISLQ